MRLQRSPYSERNCRVALVTESGSPPVAICGGGSGGSTMGIGSAAISAAVMGSSGEPSSSPLGAGGAGRADAAGDAGATPVASVPTAGGGLMVAVCSVVLDTTGGPVAHEASASANAAMATATPSAKIGL